MEGEGVLGPSLHLYLHYGYRLSFSKESQRIEKKKKEVHRKYMSNASGESSPLVLTLQAEEEKENVVVSDFSPLRSLKAAAAAY